MMLRQLYVLADNLQMELSRSGRGITGSRDALLAFGELRVYAKLSVVSSHVYEAGASVLVRVLGDIGLLVTVEGETARCLVVDLGRLPRQGDKLLAKAKPVAGADAEKLVGGATAARFSREGGRAWRVVEA